MEKKCLKCFNSIIPAICISIILASTISLYSQTVSDTFDTAEIPTNLGSYSSTCNGPLTKLSISLPAGGPWTVTSIDISYNMTAQGGGLKLHQRSYVRCQNTSTSEATVYQGTGNGGVQSYSRTGVNIANGPYSGNTILQFEMRAWRTAIGSGCSSANNRVDNFTWIITVHYSQNPDEGSVGIGTTTPATSAILDLTSTTQAFLLPRMTSSQRDAIASPVSGMVIFNTTTQILEVFSSGWGGISFSSPEVKKLLGGSGSDGGISVQQTSDGGYIIAGFSSSSNSGTLAGLTNNGGFDSWLVKVDANGNISWQKLFGGSSDDYFYSVQQTSDGGYILAGYSSSSNTGTLTGISGNGMNDGWIVKLNGVGNIVWQKLLGGSDPDLLYSVQQTIDNGYIVTGTSLSSNSGTLTGITSNGMGDAWTIKLDMNGTTVWQKLLGGSQGDESESVRQTTDGGYIVGGGALSSNTGTLLGFINNGLEDYWIFKLDNSGNIVWQKLIGGSNGEYITSVGLTSNGGYIVEGNSGSSNTGTLAGLINNGAPGIYDIWIVKLNDVGEMEWQKLLGGSSDEIASNILQTQDNGYIFTASTPSSNSGTLSGLLSNGLKDIWIVKLDNGGNLVWQKLYGGSMDESYPYIQKATDGGYIISSYTSSSNTGSLTGFTNNGSFDMWFFKLDKYGNFY